MLPVTYITKIKLSDGEREGGGGTKLLRSDLLTGEVFHYYFWVKLGAVYMIPDRVSIRKELAPVSPFLLL